MSIYLAITTRLEDFTHAKPTAVLQADRATATTIPAVPANTRIDRPLQDMSGDVSAHFLRLDVFLAFWALPFVGVAYSGGFALGRCCLTKNGVVLEIFVRKQ